MNKSLLHFVGFSDNRYLTAVKYFGQPDFVHRYWDARAVSDVSPEDVVLFADGDDTQPVTKWSYNDSAYF